MYLTYILKSENLAKTYVGITSNISRRLVQHNNGYHTYTKRYCPWYVVYLEGFENRKDARLREKHLKSSAGRRWLKKYIFEN